MAKAAWIFLLVAASKFPSTIPFLRWTAARKFALRLESSLNDMFADLLTYHVLGIPMMHDFVLPRLKELYGF